MIVDGSVHFSGQRRQTAVHEMERAAARPTAFDLNVETIGRGPTLELSVAARGAVAKRELDRRVVAALVAKKAPTTVAHGENAGETLDEAAVVRALSDRVPLPSGRGAAHLQLAKPADLAWSDLDVVVFAQSEATREIGAVVHLGSVNVAR
jgi:hypothetical protein